MQMDTWEYASLESHLVAICFVYVQVDKGRRPVAGPKSFSASGFVVEIDGEWFFITAGHVLGEGILEKLESGQIRLDHCSLADYFGRNAKVQHPTVISFEGTPKFHIDDWSLGLDVGALKLRPFYVEGLKSNGVEAIPEREWFEQETVDNSSFVILGLPDQEKDKSGHSVVEHVRPCVAGVTQCELAVPDDQRRYPIFIGRLNSNEPDSMVGFSGGPIFRVEVTSSGRKFTLHAIQSRWRKSERVVMGCPMTVVAQLIREKLLS